MYAAVDYSRGIEDAWARVASFVPKLLGFLVVLVVGYFVAKAIGKIFDGVLERVGFDKAVERGGVKKALANSRYDASTIVSKIVFYALFLLVLQLAFGIFGANPVSRMIEGVVAYLPKVFAAIVIVVVAAAIAAAVKEIVESALGGLSYGKGLAMGASTVILVVGAFAALSQLQIAPAIINGLFYALLAIVVGSAVIAIGGGGVKPMQQRWQQALERWDGEKPQMQQQMDGAGSRIQERAQELKEKAKAESGDGTSGNGRVGARNARG
jgi:Mechanosensitive ion channel, conserved TM helix